MDPALSTEIGFGSSSNVNMTDRNSPSLARRSSLPLVQPPPYHHSSTTSPKLHPPQVAGPSSGASSSSTSTSRPRLGSGAPTSPLLYRDPTFPMRDPPASSPSGSSQPMRSVPAPAVASGAGPSSSSASSSSSMSRRPSDASTAPTTPQLGSGAVIAGGRVWRPTTHVPGHIHRRHRQNGLVDEPTESDEQHRWLSEDEGTGGGGGGPSRLAGTRRRREHRSSDPRSHQDHDDDGGGGYGSAGPTAASASRVRPDRPTTGRTHRIKPDRIESSFDTVTLSSANADNKSTKRPIIRRAVSMEHPQSSPSRSTLGNVGAEPPRIQDLVPPPTSPVAVARGMGSGSGGATFTTHVAEGPPPSNQLPQAQPEYTRPDSVVSSVIPDFAPGRGGDGIGGADRPSGSDKDGENSRAALQARIERQKETLGKLRRILGW